MGVNAHTNFALRKNGKQELVPLDPALKGKLQPEMEAALEPILSTTYGLVIYQEQVMEIAQKLAGYTDTHWPAHLADADCEATFV